MLVPRLHCLSFVVLTLLLHGCGPAEGTTQISWVGEGPAESIEVGVWQGMDFIWTYNHRWNRCGGGVFPDAQHACPSGHTLRHAAASGSGRDEAQVDHSVAELVSPNVQFVQVAHTFDVPVNYRLRDAREASATLQISLDAEALEAWRAADELVPVLQGFDLRTSEGEAGKPMAFSLTLGEAELDEEAQALTVSVDVVLRLGCSTLECPERGKYASGEGGAAYKVQVNVAVLGTSSAVQEATLDRSFVLVPLPDFYEDPAATLELPWTAGPTDVQALQGVTFELQPFGMEEVHDVHMLGWASAFRSDDTLGLNFVNGQHQMSRNNILSFPDYGNTHMQADVVLVRDVAEEVRIWDAFGQLYWPGQNKQATFANSMVEMCL